MPEIVEIFVLKMKDPELAQVARRRAHLDFSSLPGLASWRTLHSRDQDRPLLFADVFTFEDLEAAKRLGAQFSQREATRAYLDEVEEILVGQHFIDSE